MSAKAPVAPELAGPGGEVREFTSRAAITRLLGTGILILVALGLLLGWVGGWSARGHLIFTGCWVAYLAVFGGRGLWRAGHSRIRVSAECIEHVEGAKVTRWPWSAVRAVWDGDDTRHPSLFLATDSDWLGIPARLFDVDSIRSYARARLGDGAFAASARADLAFNRQLDGQLNAAIAAAGTVRVGSNWALKVMIAFCMAAGAVGIATADSLAVVVICSAVLTLPALALASYGSLELDRTGVTRSAWYGHYHMSWDEIALASTDRAEYGLVIDGADKRLVTLGPGSWGGPHAALALVLITRELERRGKRFRRGKAPAFAITRNCRVARE